MELKFECLDQLEITWKLKFGYLKDGRMINKEDINELIKLWNDFRNEEQRNLILLNDVQEKKYLSYVATHIGELLKEVEKSESYLIEEGAWINGEEMPSKQGFTSYEIERFVVDSYYLIEAIKEYTSTKKVKQSLSGTLNELREKKLAWNATQKELAELFVMLEKKKWIGQIQQGDYSILGTKICSLFDISRTKKKKETNEVASFIKILTPTYDHDGTPEWPQIFAQRYVPKFSEIKGNVLP